MSIKAMQYALEVLENFVEDPRCEAHRIAAVHFLKEAIDISQERVDETAKDRHKWVDLTQEEVEEIYKETQDEFQFSQVLAYKLREKNSEWNGKGWA